jgi:hypothetical protein
MATQPTPIPTPLPPTRKPNFYALHGGHLQITFSTSGIDGRPHFHYRDTFQSREFIGDQIKITDTEIGTLVTVTTHLTPDSGSTTFTLVVPRVNLGSSTETTIHTFGITTHHRFSIVPALNIGQLETYNVTQVQGTAAFVFF